MYFPCHESPLASPARLMLSATPVNNRFSDLKNQLALAYDNGRARTPPMGWNSWCTGGGASVGGGGALARGRLGRPRGDGQPRLGRRAQGQQRHQARRGQAGRRQRAARGEQRGGSFLVSADYAIGDHRSQ